MDGLSNSINALRKRLETAGSVFSYDEIHDILRGIKDVQLKLIIANVPSPVFSSDNAREAFESLFKSFDIHSKFVYLPSFKRAQIYMTTPEATLCARLQSQGWKLPDSFLNNQLDSSEETSSQPDDGISCFIDQVDCILESGSEEASDAADSTEDNDETDDLETQKHCLHCFSFNSEALSSSVPTVATHSRQTGEACIRKEEENATEVSGDDNVCELPQDAADGEPDKPEYLCRKHRRLERLRNEKQHLAPPKPSRLFLLSPPCSPPVGWQPKPESEPVINYDLLEALAALSPGEQFELHPRNDKNSHPSIVITPCENTVSTSEDKQSRIQIVQTRCPQRKS